MARGGIVGMAVAGDGRGAQAVQRAARGRRRARTRPAPPPRRDRRCAGRARSARRSRWRWRFSAARRAPGPAPAPRETAAAAGRSRARGAARSAGRRSPAPPNRPPRGRSAGRGPGTDRRRRRRRSSASPSSATIGSSPRLPLVATTGNQLPQQQVMQRRGGQHDAETRAAGRDGRGQRSAAAQRAQQHDRRFRPRQQVAFRRGDLGQRACGGQVADHHGEGLARRGACAGARSAPPLRCAHRPAAGIRPAPSAPRSGPARSAAAACASAASRLASTVPSGVPQRQLRAAGGAGDRFRRGTGARPGRRIPRRRRDTAGMRASWCARGRRAAPRSML